MNITEQTPVGALVAASPATARIFEALGVDYCCGGKATLREASVQAAIPFEDLLLRLRDAMERPSPGAPGSLMHREVPEIIDHLEQKHHTFTRTELARLEPLLNKVLHAHGDRRPELIEVARIFGELSRELEVHLQKEERILFPYLRALALALSTGQPLRRPPFQSARNPLGVMHQEHEAAGIFLHQLRELTDAYTPPPGACPTFHALYQGLSALHEDLIEHIHLENNVLFPRALPLEQQVFAGP
jgi:regulator of cell morphogenesis and NO signaling